MGIAASGPLISVSVVVVDPSASVANIAPEASTSYASPNASVSYATPEAVASYVIPAAALSYIEIVSSVYMDDSGRYQYKADTFAVVDQTAFSTSKSITDDSFSFVDAVALTPAPTYADSISFSDVVVPVLVFLRDFTEALTVPDSQVLLVSPAYVETLAPTDTIAFSHSKAFDDGFAMNDMADAGGPVWSFSDTTANIVTMSDSSLLSSDKGVSDSVSAADSGVLSMQDYCDLTYFLEDYVGTSRTF